LTIAAGVTLTVPSGSFLRVSANGLLDNRGTVQNGGEIEGWGDINNASGATIQGSGGVTVQGTFTNDGTVETGGTLWLYPAGGPTFTNNGTATLQSVDLGDGSLTNQAGGSLTIRGNTALGAGSISNAGDLTNLGTMYPSPYDPLTGRIDNLAGGQISNSGSIQIVNAASNAGTVVNTGSGTLTVPAGSTFDNTGVLFNDSDTATIANDGSVANTGYIYNRGIVSGSGAFTTGGGTIHDILYEITTEVVGWPSDCELAVTPADPVPSDPDGNGLYAYRGGSYTLTVLPCQGYSFNGWTVAGATVTDPSQTTITITGEGAILEIQADFEIIEPAGSVCDAPTKTCEISGNATLNENWSPPDDYRVLVDPGAHWTIANGATLTMTPGTTLEVGAGAQIDNDGTMALQGEASVQLNARINNSGSIQIEDDADNAGTVVNSGSGTLTVANGASLNNSGVVFNQSAGATITNNGSVANSGYIYNRGIVSGSGPFTTGGETAHDVLYPITITSSSATCAVALTPVDPVPADPDGNALYTYESGLYTLTAAACSGYTFKGWTVTGASVADPLQASATLTAQGAAATVQGVFEKIAPPPQPKPKPSSSSPSGQLSSTGPTDSDPVGALSVAFLALGAAALVWRRRALRSMGS
jgi:hypothetical protein